MTTNATTVSKVSFAPLQVALAAALGLGIIVITGHVQADALHAAAHDVRHAHGFPCH